ncbi:MAG: ankyrin repeat and protein kinase domain-containing protein [Thermoprotei archaeon]
MTPLFWREDCEKLHTSAVSGDLSELERLLKKGCDPNVKDELGKTPLHKTSWFGYFEATKLLLEKGADPNATDVEGMTPLHYASRTGRAEIVRLLISRGANPNARDLKGRTPLHFAAETGSVEVINILISNRAVINARDNFGRTPLHLAVERGRAAAVEALIKEGALTNLGDADRKALLKLAQERGFEEIVRLLGGGEGTAIKAEEREAPTSAALETLKEVQVSPEKAAFAKARLLGKSMTSGVDKITWLGSSVGIYRVTGLLGEGGYSITYSASFGGGNYAVRVLKVDEELSLLSNALRSFPDLSFMAKDKLFVRPLAISVDLLTLEYLRRGQKAEFKASPPFVAEELAEGGSMASLMREPDLFSREAWERASINAVRTAAEALSLLHSKGYVHTNVKPSSILLRKKVKTEEELEKAEFALGDLIVSVRVGSRPTVYNPEFYPPEALVEGAKPYSDVFALAVTLYVLLTGRNDRPDLESQLRAYGCLTAGDLNCARAEVERAKRALESWYVDLSPELNDLLRSALSPDPLKRPTAREFADRLKMTALA